MRMELIVLRWKPEMVALVFDPRTIESSLQMMGLQPGIR
jgi:hypothetical protein